MERIKHREVSIHGLQFYRVDFERQVWLQDAARGRNEENPGFPRAIASGNHAVRAVNGGSAAA